MFFKLKRIAENWKGTEWAKVGTLELVLKDKEILHELFEMYRDRSSVSAADSMIRWRTVTSSSKVQNVFIMKSCFSLPGFLSCSSADLTALMPSSRTNTGSSMKTSEKSWNNQEPWMYQKMCLTVTSLCIWIKICDAYISLDLRTVGGTRSAQNVPMTQSRFQELFLKAQSLRCCLSSVHLTHFSTRTFKTLVQPRCQTQGGMKLQ